MPLPRLAARERPIAGGSRVRASDVARAARCLTGETFDVGGKLTSTGNSGWGGVPDLGNRRVGVVGSGGAGRGFGSRCASVRGRLGFGMNPRPDVGWRHR
jgi:hypothetical protein